MTQQSIRRNAVIVVALGLALVAVLSAQSATAPQSDALVSEIRALRAEVVARLDDSVRAQLLVARLQLQEQRINTIVRQLDSVQEQLRANERARAPIEAQLRGFEESQSKLPADRQPEVDVFVAPLRANVEEMNRSMTDLRRQESSLTNLLTDEQSRWTALNTRLEQLERAFAKTR